MNTYPPSPWHLRAHAYVGMYVVPVADTPAVVADTTPITFFGRAIVCAAYFVYEEPSPLTYNEVMATMLVRKGWRPYVTISRIWVDSPASRDGGRELWAIPKDLADFVVTPHSSYASTEKGAAIGSLKVSAVKAVPIAVPIGFRIAQERDRSMLATKVKGRGPMGIAKARWTFNPDGPLGHLAGRKPILTLALRKLSLVFGD